MSENSTVKKTIYQYNADGKFVTSYPSIGAASLATGIHRVKIGRWASKIPAVLFKENIILNFNKFKKLEDIKNINKPGGSFKGIKIYTYSLDGTLLKIFNSTSEAARYFNIDDRKVKRRANKNLNITDLTLLSVCDVCDDKYIFTFEPLN
jgi:hypothetical protein